MLALAVAGCAAPVPPSCCQPRVASGPDVAATPAAMGSASAVPLVDRREGGGGGSPDGTRGAAVFGDRSLFHSETSWVGDDGRSRRLAALSGRPQVVAMFFASCQFTCPVIVHDMRRIEAALDPATRARVGFALVSFDSRRDTPEALAGLPGRAGPAASGLDAVAWGAGGRAGVGGVAGGELPSRMPGVISRIRIRSRCSMRKGRWFTDWSD